MPLLANIVLGLIVFGSVCFINVAGLKNNPWIGITSITEASLTFAAVYLLARGFHLSSLLALLLAALAMATSPATFLCIINEEKSAGQVTERTLHLAVLDCVLAVLVFKMIIGLMILRTSGDFWQASYNSLIVLLISASLGTLFGFIVPWFLRIIKHTHTDSTLAFAMTVIFLVLLTHILKQSSILATLTFGLVARHRRIVLSPSQRNFGVLGNFLAMILFVFIATTLDWHKVVIGIGLGLAIIFVRYLAKIAGISCFAHLSGISYRKGLLIATAMTPISAFIILALEQTHYLGIDLVTQLAPLTATALTLEIFGPMLTLLALYYAHEIPHAKEF